MNPTKLPAAKLIQNLPTVRTSLREHSIVNYIIGANVGIFGLYMFSSGPTGLRMQRQFTVTPDSGIQSLLTFHMVHTEPLPLLFNCGILATVGAYHRKAFGYNSFLRLFGVGAAAASLAVAIGARYNHD